jgi:hypothetical protein
MYYTPYDLIFQEISEQFYRTKAILSKKARKSRFWAAFSAFGIIFTVIHFSGR